ncbi:MAG TPA: acetate--CoA ligase family protein [Burkholderiales bacterium]|nr:acetate--CoA ligase family protein [Burkholderiales bacterium]
MPEFADLGRFFAPRRVAFVGATEDLAKFGGRCMRLLIDFGYRGDIYPVNPKRAEIFGLRCYPSLADLPQVPDHVGIVLPSGGVRAALEDCVRLGVPFATVFSAGFAETGSEEGKARQQQAVAVARAGGLRFMGPNCNGMINFADAFALTSTAAIKGARRPAGDIGVVSQSGGAGQVNVMWRAQEAGLGVSYQVSCGNDADLDLLDYMAFMVESERTKVVLALAERIPDGERLRALAQRAAALDKPIVMVKVGRTEAGSRAAASHTGSITGADEVCDAALRQMGIVRVTDTSELYETAMLLRTGRRAAGTRAAATSISGGNLVMVADLGSSVGIDFPPFADATQARLKEFLPGFSATANPTDLTAAAIGRKDTFASVTRILAEDPGIDALVPVITFSPADEIRSIAGVSASSAKPVAILWTGKCSDDASVTPGALVAEGHAVYRDALPCMKALRAAMRYAEFRRHLGRPAPDRPPGIDADAARIVLSGAKGALSEHRSKALLACYGLPCTREHLARDEDAAVRLARESGGAVALKIQSPDIPHKTEAKAIRLGVSGDEAVRRAFREVTDAARAYRAGAAIEGVLVQEMVEGGHEVLLGVSRDPTFGPVLTVGLGGVYVEVLKDLAFRLPPLSAEESLEALRELRAYPLLQGFRGRPRVDIGALAGCIERLSWLAADLSGEIAELDINPLRVLPQGRGARVVDALVVLK